MEFETADPLFEKKGEFVSRSIAGETILVPVRGRAGDLEAIYNLNDAGSFIWTLINGQNTLGRITDAVCAEFEVPREQAATDTMEFLRALEQSGIAQAAGPAN